MQEKILIIEDEEELIRGLTLNLTGEGYRVDYAMDGIQGLKKAQESPPHLILLDLMLPGMGGLEVCRQLRRKGLDTPVIILTAKGEEIDKVVGLELGADDYVTKPFGRRELLARIKARLRRENRIEEAPQELYITGNITVDFRRFKVRRGREEFDLTSLEMDVLKHLIANRGKVVTREELLARIWSGRDDFSTRTIDNHILKLRKKIEDSPAHPRHILSVYGEGYRFVEG